MLFRSSKDISYAGCGLPYHISGLIPDKDSLVVNTPEKFSMLTGVNVKTEMEAIKIDPNRKSVLFKDNTEVNYDKLVIATGATPIVPNIEGVDRSNVFTLRTVEDAVNIKRYIEEKSVKSAVIVGASFIGLEVAENIKAKGVNVTVADLADQVLPNLFDQIGRAHV